MALYDNVDDLIAHLTNDVKASLKDIKKYCIDDAMAQAIDETVYSVKFDVQNEYKRREEQGGLKDKRNFESDVIDTLNGVEMTIRNTTTGNRNYPHSTSDMIDEIIVSGKGYTWENSSYYLANEVGRPIKRDFYKATHEKIKDHVGDLLAQELKSKGW